MLYKGYVSCSSLISSVGETEMKLLGFRKESLALKLEKLQRTSISQCNIYFFCLQSPVSSSLLVTPVLYQLTRPLLKRLGWRNPSLLSYTAVTGLVKCLMILHSPLPLVPHSQGISPIVLTWQPVWPLQPKSHPDTLDFGTSCGGNYV